MRPESQKQKAAERDAVKRDTQSWSHPEATLLFGKGADRSELLGKSQHNLWEKYSSPILKAVSACTIITESLLLLALLLSRPMHYKYDPLDGHILPPKINLGAFELKQTCAMRTTLMCLLAEHSASQCTAAHHTTRPGPGTLRLWHCAGGKRKMVRG
ncbi:hypothetical protein WMY93_008815 [Mugilogobius chulae]|uniref:Uncharacterized protein n=1 Tax=Mugilogobius chulae TaxID=88201 RepID=A0AAW0PIN6_9GOBI